VRVGSQKLTDIHAGEARPLAHHEVTQLASCARRPTTTRPAKRAAPTAKAGGAAGHDSPRIVLAPGRYPRAVSSDQSTDQDRRRTPPRGGRRRPELQRQEHRRRRGRAPAWLRFCDTGLLYRAVAWLAVERGIAPDQTSALVPLAGRGAARRRQARPASPRGGRRSRRDGGSSRPRVDRAVSDYSKVPELRAVTGAPPESARRRWRGSSWPAATSGRSSCPDARCEDLPPRLARRSGRAGGPPSASSPRMEQQPAGFSRTCAAATLSTRARNRPAAQAEDAIVVKTDGNTFKQTVAAVIRTIREAEAGRRRESWPVGGCRSPSFLGRRPSGRLSLA